VAKDPTLSPAVADAVVAAIRSGGGIGERKLGRSETFHWMAYQPSKGDFELIAPPCVSLKQDYDAFEITVEVPEPAPAAAAAAAACVVSAQRNCEPANPTITVSVAGSSRNARVTMTAPGQSPTPVTLAGTSATVSDLMANSADLVFTVRAEGAPPAAQMARQHRFVIPKICGNLSYLGEVGRRQIAGPAAAATCEKSVTTPRCRQAPPPVVAAPAAAPAEEATAAACWDASNWVARGFAFWFDPQGDEQHRDITVPFGATASEDFELGSGYGVGASLERRLSPHWGFEGAALLGRGDSEYELTVDGVTGSASHNVNFYALLAGPNFHLLECSPDLYLGIFAGLGGFADPNYWVAGHHFAASFDGRFVYGAQLGLDLPFGKSSNWGLHGGVRYFQLDQKSDAGTLKVDPLLVELGLAYRF
jgi:hypothetical protein